MATKTKVKTEVAQICLHVLMGDIHGQEGYAVIDGYVRRHEGWDDVDGTAYGSDYRCLKFRAQTDYRRLNHRSEFPVYGHDLEWDAENWHGDNAEGLRKGAKVLTRTNAALTKYSEAYGPPATYGWLIARTAKAIGAERVIVRCRAAKGERVDRDLTPKEAAWAIDSQIGRWSEAAKPHARPEDAE